MQKLLKIIQTKDLNEKIQLGKNLVKDDISSINPLSSSELESLKIPGRPANIKIVAPVHVPKRNMQSIESRINFLHAIAHIELLAIELPALSFLRFGSQNPSFIKDQFQVISEEAKHFELLKDRLQELGGPFTSRSIHMGLWDCAWKCQSELEHQIVIPCYLEARGLDVCPEFINKLKSAKDLESANIMQIILDDEIGHVHLGLKYLQYKAQEQSLTPDELFEKTLKQFFQGQIKSRIPINQDIRKLAGFSEYQLNLLA